MSDIDAFVAERNEMLLAGDIDLLIAFHAKHNPELPPMTNRTVAEITLHKSRTAAKGLPMEARLHSKRWLAERGYKSWDDGELGSALTQRRRLGSAFPDPCANPAMVECAAWECQSRNHCRLLPTPPDPTP